MNYLQSPDPVRVEAGQKNGRGGVRDGKEGCQKVEKGRGGPRVATSPAAFGKRGPAPIDRSVGAHLSRRPGPTWASHEACHSELHGQRTHTAKAIGAKLASRLQQSLQWGLQICTTRPDSARRRSKTDRVQAETEAGVSCFCLGRSAQTNVQVVRCTHIPEVCMKSIGGNR
jgi:hypothetical protein